MNKPFWYRIYSRELSTEKVFSDNNLNKEHLITFILHIIYEHDIYMEDGSHILLKLLQEDVSDVEFYMYLYWVLGRDWKKEKISREVPQLGKFGKHNVKMSKDFDTEYVNDRIVSLLKKFFSVGALCLPLTKFNSKKHTGEACDYGIKIIQQSIQLPSVEPKKIFLLKQSHQHVTELSDFFQGKCIPSYLKSHRKNFMFVKSVIYQYWPSVLKTLVQESPLSSKEMDVLREAHQLLYEKGDIGFFNEYVDLMKKFFPSHKILEDLESLLSADPKRDIELLSKHFEQLSPKQRLGYFPSMVPVSDYGLDKFMDNVGKKGFEQSFVDLIINLKNHVISDMEQFGGQIINQETISTGESIWIYPYNQLIFHSEADKCFVFMKSELPQLKKDGTNPYTRTKLPENLFVQECEKEEICGNYEEIWSDVLRRRVNLEELVSL